MDQAKIRGKISVWLVPAWRLLLTFGAFEPALQDKVAKCARVEEEVLGELIPEAAPRQDPRELQLTSPSDPQSCRTS